MPNLVRRDQLESANQLSLITTYGVTPVLGAALFSVLSLITTGLARHLSFFRTNPTNLALYFNAGTFLFGALVVLFIREISGSRSSRPTGEQAGLFALIREGASFVRSSELIGGLILGLVGAFPAGGAVIGAGHTFVGSLGGGNAAYGVLFGAVFVGLGLGMALGPRVARELSRRRLFGLSIVFGGICLALTGVMPQVALAMFFVLGVGFGAGLAYLSGVTLMGTEVDDVMRGRVFALLQSLIRVVLILALAVVNFIVAQVGRRTLSIGSWHATVDGTRFVLVGFGLVAVALGLLAYRKMDDKQTVGIWDDVRSSLRGDSIARRRLSGGGVLIAFEGGEGSGKSTQIEALADSLRSRGIAVTVTREPGATEVGAQIRRVLLDTDQAIAPRAEALLFAADRAHHVTTVIEPALAAGDIVLTDRYVDSSLAYQGAGRDLTVEDVRRLSRWATGGLTPDLTVLLDVPAEVGLSRASRRSAADRLERESIEFHERVRAAYRGLAESAPARYLVLDARTPPEEQAAEIRATVDRLMSDERSPRSSGSAGRRPGGPDMTAVVTSVWDDLIGQADTVAVLRAAADAAAATAEGRPAQPGAMTHAWLFTGPAGSGRSVAARALAAALQCTTADDLGCGHCSACHTVRAGSHPDVRLVVPEGLSISVGEMRALVASASRRPSLGRWQVMVIEDADRLTEGAFNALLKVIEEPPSRTVFLLCAPSTHPDDVAVTIRSRCRVVPLRTPPVEAVAAVLTRDGVPADIAGWAAAASQGHVGRARRLARDPEARDRRAAVLAIPASLTSLKACVDAADQLVSSAEAEAAGLSSTLDSDETEALQTALGAGATGKGTATAVRGMAGAIKDLERRQRSRATRTQRDALDRALVDIAAFYRDVLLVQSGSSGPFAHPDFTDDVRAVAARITPARTLRPARRRPGLPAGGRAERQADHCRAGDDRRAAAAGLSRNRGQLWSIFRHNCPRFGRWLSSPGGHGVRGDVPAPGPALLRRPR